MSECCICFDDVLDDGKQLICNHFMHNTCYVSFLKSPAQKKCPMCRKDIFKDMNICQICKLEMNIDPAKCEVIQSNTCGCLFHYHCLKERKTFYCFRCYNVVNIEFSDFLSYLYFSNFHINVIGAILNCKNEGCRNTGNPSRFGYCQEHSIVTSSNKAIILSFMYFSRFVNEIDDTKKYNILLEIIKYMNINHKYNDPEEVNFIEINKIINKDNILHN